MAAISDQLSGGSLGAAELRRRLGVSPATLMRMARQTPGLLRLGRARASRYALRQAWPGLGTDAFPLVRITASGEAVSTGQLVTLAGRESVRLPDETLFDGLPVELMDARPQGFLGRAFAALHPELDLPPRVTDWSDHHVLLALSRRGEDLPGDLIVGEESFRRWQDLAFADMARAEYSALADAALRGHPPGSSAGGERPKFGVFSGGRHVLVKFAARGGPSDSAARRWADLLLLEALALEVAGEAGALVATTSVVEAAAHVFLESERFDREGVRGRRPVLSLAAAGDDPAASWTSAARTLGDQGRLSADDARRLRWLDAFGALIANTDRHQFNVTCFPEPDGRVRLAPLYDMLPMFYAPTPDGLAAAPPMPRPRLSALMLDVWDSARASAVAFWRRAADETRLSDELRRAAVANVRLLTPGPVAYS